MTPSKELRKASLSLQQHLDTIEGKYTVGIAYRKTYDLCIFTNEDHSNLPTEWEGFSVSHRTIPKAL